MGVKNSYVTLTISRKELLRAQTALPSIRAFLVVIILPEIPLRQMTDESKAV